MDSIAALFLRANGREWSLDIDVSCGFWQFAVQRRAVDHAYAKHLFAELDELSLAIGHDADEVARRQLNLGPRRIGSADGVALDDR
ncbi:MAG: hypothetical protein OXN96_14075 [Bryobacterales bacterium]|nr:hypothetical protein [Bryobacterales bacterium]